MKRNFRVGNQFTTYTEKSFSTYLEEVSKIKLLTPEEEYDIAVVAATGDRVAINKLISHNLRFVISVAKQYTNRTSKLEDLVDEGNIGLHDAAIGFDPSRGFKFISYAVWHVRKRMTDYSNKHSRMVRLPINKISALNKLKTTYRNLEQKLEREPTPEELFAHCNDTSIRLEELVKLINMESTMHKSINAPVAEDGDEFSAFIPCKYEDETDYNMNNEDLKTVLYDMMRDFTPAEVSIVEFSYGMNGKEVLTLKEIGRELGVSGELVRQKKKKILQKLLIASRKGDIFDVGMYL